MECHDVHENQRSFFLRKNATEEREQQSLHIPATYWLPFDIDAFHIDCEIINVTTTEFQRRTNHGKGTKNETILFAGVSLFGIGNKESETRIHEKQQ